MGHRFSLYRSSSGVQSALTATYDLKLTEIDQLIEQTQQSRVSTRQRYSTISRTIVVYGFIIELFISICTYIFHDTRGTASQKVQHVLPLACSLILLLVGKRLVTAYYSHRIAGYDRYIVQLENRRDEFVEQLMAATDFKRIATVIEQHNKKKLLQSGSKQPVPQAAPAASTPAHSAVKSAQNTQSARTPHTPAASGAATPAHQSTASIPYQPDWSESDARQFQRVDIVAPAAVRQRTTADKVVDFVLGDGPNNRYALICRSCATHNGLVRDEHADVKFRCLQCGTVNQNKVNTPTKTLIDTTTALQEALHNVQQQQNQAAQTSQPATHNHLTDATAERILPSSTTDNQESVHAAARTAWVDPSLIASPLSLPDTSTSSVGESEDSAAAQQNEQSDKSLIKRRNKKQRP